MVRRYLGTGVAIAVLGLALVPSSASAAGEVSNPSWSCYGNGICGMSYTVAGTANHRVFYLNTPRPVGSPTIYSGAQGTCQVAQPDGNPNQFECFISGAGATPGTRITAWWQGSRLDSTAHLQLFTNTTGTPPYNGPFDVGPAQQTTQRNDETNFNLRLARTARTLTGFRGEFRHTTTQGWLPDPGWDETFGFPSGFDYLADEMPRCTWGQVRAGAGCGRARLGTATFTAYAHRCDDLLMPSDLMPITRSFTLINGGPHEIYGRFGTGASMLTFEVNVNRNKLHITLPDRFISPSPGVCTPVTDVKLNVPLKRISHQAVGPFMTGRCPSNHIWQFTDLTKFTDGARGKNGALLHNTVDTSAKVARGTCRTR
jgi:hypothetical protein